MKRTLLLLLASAFLGTAMAVEGQNATSFFLARKDVPEGSGAVWLTVMSPQKHVPPSKPGRVRVNVEPGCLLPEAIVEALPGNRYRFEFPEDDYFSRQARQVLGLKGKACIIRYEPGGKNQSHKVIEVTEMAEQKPAERAAE